ncbi:hypothetical protein DFH01_14340 [Falsiroseomonas bella]|uniref:Uncharacterized protein n=1 Tax=Falsiroseomonas bella TaxID=2184016 RepID=A0A317FB67_9PROT|nr:hypothetical protein [Falsiroseomonas bella]PWS36350.1 hypothetical protein DFH01_14340 [Falsiroseomonas bella]
MRMRLLGLALLAVSAAVPARAQAPAPPPGPPTVETMDRGLINLGLMAGHAFQCLPEPEREAAQRRLLAFNGILVAEMGANAAFRFASSFGAGASHEVDRSFCERSLADWRKLLHDHGMQDR